MRALVVYCHPKEGSFNSAVRDTVMGRLEHARVETRLRDLYAEGFQPVLTRDEWVGYEDTETNRKPVADYCDDILWCDTLIFVYPTWWYGLPAMLKGWLDRVLLPDVAFHMPKAEGEIIKPGLHHIERLGVFTTCGASRWLTMFIGAPGKRTLMRGVGLLLKPRAKKAFAAHFLMDTAPRASLEKHLKKVAAKTDTLIGMTASRRAPLEGAPAE
ncbi:MAG: NAD(P)H-dependent oxidoreductase [Pseudomonadota bacterium]